MTSASAIEAVAPGFFDISPVPPPVGSSEFSLSEWNERRDAGISPAYHSGFSDVEQNRLEFLEGARLMGFTGPGTHLHPQQLAISDTLALPKSAYVIEIPRRASKTTSLFLTFLGRCALRPGYKVTYSGSSGIAGSAQFLDWVIELDDASPPDDLHLPPWLRGQARQITKAQSRSLALFGPDFEGTPETKKTSGRGFRVMKGEVNKGIYFDNGSSFTVLRPDAKAYRGKAADISWLDEAQEQPIDEGAALLAAIRPLQDTRPGAALVLSGTAGEVRAGMFWDMLVRGRAGDPKIGIIDYAAPENTEWEEIEDIDRAMALLLTVHPGINTLTTLETMRDRYIDIPLPQWAREYLSMWPESFGISAIPADWWVAAMLEKRLAYPQRVAFGFAVRRNGSVSSIAAAWRNTRGVAYIEIVEHKSGTTWLPLRGQDLSKKYRGSTLAYDDISSECRATVIEMQTLRPKPRTRILGYKDQAAACVRFLRDLENGRIRHFDQLALNDAVTHASKREIRGDRGVWFWGATTPEGDITALNAATSALANWDKFYAGKSTSSAPIMGV